MYSKYDWFLAIIRIAGASFPGTSSLVQLQAELDSNEMKKRLDKLEDPISYLHEDVPKLSRLIYSKLKNKNSTNLEFEDEFYENFSKPLAALESKEFIKGLHSLGHRYQSGIEIIDPIYIMYLCAISEENEKMQTLIEILENCEAGTFLRSKDLDVDLPLPVFRAVFKIYVAKGYGIRTNTVEADNCSYLCKA